MALSSIESNSSTAHLHELIGGQRVDFSFERPLYTDRQVYELELEGIFRKRWLFLDHLVRIPAPGDYFVRELAGESIIVIRGHDGEIRAFYNVCRHRGSRICLQSEGHVERLVCPYHAWAYQLDGHLQSARQMPADFKPADYGLLVCHLRVVEGLIFVCLSDEEPPDFDETVSPFRKRLIAISPGKSTAIQNLGCEKTVVIPSSPNVPPYTP